MAKMAKTNGEVYVCCSLETRAATGLLQKVHFCDKKEISKRRFLKHVDRPPARIQPYLFTDFQKGRPYIYIHAHNNK